jgi:hypothetical protein
MNQIPEGRHMWIQMARGEARLGDIALFAGDGVAISDEKEVVLTGVSDPEIPIFDLI